MFLKYQREAGGWPTVGEGTAEVAARYNVVDRPRVFVTSRVVGAACGIPERPHVLVTSGQ